MIFTKALFVTVMNWKWGKPAKGRWSRYMHMTENYWSLKIMTATEESGRTFPPVTVIPSSKWEQGRDEPFLFHSTHFYMGGTAWKQFFQYRKKFSRYRKMLKVYTTPQKSFKNVRATISTKHKVKLKTKYQCQWLLTSERILMDDFPFLQNFYNKNILLLRQKYSI